MSDNRSANAPVSPDMREWSSSAIDRFPIFQVRGQALVLGSDLAAIYIVTTGAFNQGTKRNLGPFPEDSTFVLGAAGFEALRSRFATSKPGGDGRRHLLSVLTKNASIKAAMVLNTPSAMAISDNVRTEK